MSKLNKIFLAIVVALLFTALAEVVFIFVYKPVQQIPSQTIVVQTPSPTPFVKNGLAVNPKLLTSIANWPAYGNQKAVFTVTITGVLTAINTPSGNNSNYFIGIEGTKGKDIRGFVLSQDEWNKLQVFDVRGKTSIPVKVGSLTPGETISIDQIYNAGTSDGQLPDTMTISIIK